MADIAGPMISALGAVGGAYLTADSIDRQNAIAQSQFRENMAFQKYQYEDMKRYQSPKNQVMMLREAGLNPALAMDSSLAGKSLAGVGGVSPTASVTSGDFMGLPQGAASLLQSIVSNGLSQSQEDVNYANAASKLQDSISQSIENAFKTGDKTWAQWLLKNQSQLAETDLAFMLSTFDRRVEQEQFKSALLMSQMEAAGIANKYLDEQKAADVQNTIASTAAMLASKKLSYAQATEVIARKIASFGLNEDDALDLYDSSMDVIDANIEHTNAQTFDLFSGDIKKNPFSAVLGAWKNGKRDAKYSTPMLRTQLRSQRRAARRMVRKSR